MKNDNYRLLLAAGLASVTFGLTACPSDPVPTDAPVAPTDTPATPTDTPPGTDAPVVITNDCAGYCAATFASCTGDNAQWDSMADCLAYCGDAGWDAGTPGATSGNTIACRIYHAGVAGMPGMALAHCPHTGPSGGGVCGTLTFLTAAGTRVDRMGMPAVSTALIPAARKNAYNDASPTDDLATSGTPPVPMFYADLAGSLAALHTALDDDLTAAGLAPCSLTELVDTGAAGFGMQPECIGQPIAGTGTPPVAALVLPDTLNIDPALPSGFPNGRRLSDSVIDPILAAILLDLRNPTGCASGPCTVATLATLGGVGAGLNPQENDTGFEPSTTFPYLADPHVLAP